MAHLRTCGSLPVANIKKAAVSHRARTLPAARSSRLARAQLQAALAGRLQSARALQPMDVTAVRHSLHPRSLPRPGARSVSGGGCSRAPSLRPFQPAWMPQHYNSSTDVLLGKPHCRSRADRCADAARASGTGAATQRPRCAIPRVPHAKENLSTARRSLFPSQAAWMPEHHHRSTDVLGKRHCHSRADRCADNARASGAGATTQ